MQGDHARALYPCILDEAHRALEGIPAPSVLDVGCGTGMLSEQLLSAFPSCRLTGVDLSPAMVERARARLAGRAEVREADAERLPFHDGVFDLVVCKIRSITIPTQIARRFRCGAFSEKAGRWYWATCGSQRPHAR